MSTADRTDADRERRLDEAAANFLAERAAGHRPDRQQWLAQFPDLADELGGFLDDLDRMRRTISPLVDATLGAPRLPVSAVVRLHCPHCQNPIELVVEQADDVVCPSCGSSFQVDTQRTQSWDGDRLPTFGKFKLLARLGAGAFGTGEQLQAFRGEADALGLGTDTPP